MDGIIGRTKCRLGLHAWHVRGRCIDRAIVMAGISSHGGDDRVCLRCGLEDNDMLNCRHGHRQVEVPARPETASDDRD